MESFRAKSFAPSELASRQARLQQLEQAFLGFCDDAINEMHLFIQYAESSKCLESLVDVQLAYHKALVSVIEDAKSK